MATDVAALRRGRPALAREIPHTVSPGLWTLAWRRLRSDRVGMVSLAIVAAFIVMMILSGVGLIAGDWDREVGVNYAPPTFVGAEAPAGRARRDDDERRRDAGERVQVEHRRSDRRRDQGDKERRKVGKKR